MDDIAQIVQDAATIGFDIAGGVKQTATFHIGKAQTYDAATDKTAASGGQDIPVQGIFYKDRQSQGGDETAVTAAFLVKGSDLPAGIDQADTVTIGSSTWNIDVVEPAPLNVLYIVRLRK